MKPLPIKYGDKKNKLTFLEISRVKYDGWKKINYGMFECECGNTKEILINNVIHGMSKSCGCSRKDRFKKYGNS